MQGCPHISIKQKIRSKCCMPYHDMKSVKNGQVARPSGKGKDR